MLILKRKIGQSLMIGEEIEIVVLERDGEGVRLGVRAPRSVKVYRKEIFDEIEAANRSALHLPSMDQLMEEYRKRAKKEEKG